MNPIEDDLRAAFRRHEPPTDTTNLKTKISSAYVRKKRHRTFRRSLTTAALVLAVAAVPIGLQRITASAATASAGAVAAGAVPAGSVAAGSVAAGAKGSPKVTVPSGPLNVLLVTSGSPDRALGDTFTLVHVPADRKAVYLVSFPGTAKIGPGGTTLEDAMRPNGASQAGVVLDGLTGINLGETVSLHVTDLALVPLGGAVRICLPAPIYAMPARHGYPQGCQQADPTEIGVLVRANNDQLTLRVLRALATHIAAGNPLTAPKVVGTLSHQLESRIAITGNAPGLIGVARAMNSPEVIAITGPGSAAYPGVGPSLYEAIGHDQLSTWIAANPSYVLGD